MASKKSAGVVAGEAQTAVDSSKPADIPAAKTFSPSGAPHQTVGIDPNHAAVDANPRANTTGNQNRIDFNDPTKSGSEAVTENLKKL